MNDNQQMQFQIKVELTNPHTIGELIKEQISTFEREFNNKISDIENKIEYHCSQIKSIEDKMDRLIQVPENAGLENRYMDILRLFQHLDIWVDALPEEVSDFKILAKEQISQVLAKYGYKFLDFSFEDMKSYDYEICPNDPQEIAYRAIANKSGTVAKGKVYLPQI